MAAFLFVYILQIHHAKKEVFMVPYLWQVETWSNGEGYAGC